MTQQNAQSTSEQAISENDLIAQRHAKLKQIEDQANQATIYSTTSNTNLTISTQVSLCIFSDIFFMRVRSQPGTLK